MQFLNLPFMLLVGSAISILLLLLFVLKRKEKDQLQIVFSFNLICVLIICVGVIIQDIADTLFNIDRFFFENFIYIGTCFLPVSIFFTALTFSKTKLVFKKRYLLLFVIPITSLLLLWTNASHHLFYEHYSIWMNENIVGPYFNIHLIYTYGLLLISMGIMIYAAIKTSGVFSKQSILFIIGTLTPVILNILGVYNIINFSFYVTPISISIAILCYALAIYKFNFLNISPIALQQVVDSISDGYVVINEKYTITDYNRAFRQIFNISNSVLNRNLFDWLTSSNIEAIDTSSLKSNIYLLMNRKKSKIEFEITLSDSLQSFSVEITPIINKSNSYLGTIILLKNITEHKNDLKTIEDKQNLLMEKERLASLGQLIGGIAHNLKTPIMSISGATEGLTDLVKEYDSSIGDPEVNEQDHHEIAHDMSEWIERIKTHTSYMSDIITAVKGQAVALSEEEEDTFTIDELIKRVNILMRHELKNALVELQIKMNTSSMIPLCGNVNGLVQVINNMISNAIQSYKGEPNKKIDLIVSRQDDNVVFSIQDYGCGMSQEVKDKLFKEMITTKGKNGTGLGLFMSYSTIRGHFNGNITFDSELGKGTKFNIILPCEMFQS